MPEENVKVAVRVRPFNSREKGRNAELIIGMSGAATTIKEPGSKEEPRKFNFDFSYWSHDGCKDDGTGYFGPDTSHANGKKFADQKKVYNDLGVGVLNNAWEGYNSTLFAYGQTGSGKSWSMVGYGVNKGIVPLFCDNIFRQIEEKRGSGDKTEFEVSFSMLEIYNEQVRDLLDSSSKRGGLKVRQHPKKGFYAEGLRIVPVNSYVEIEKKMEEGTTNRTVASTNMNATSSRAHTIVGITFVQKFINAAGEETAKTAVINLVDLAGSERAESTGATGDRLKEGAAINQSLSCLGNCIAALADKSSGKNIKVPYRDSVLTKLLKNALGGNSKTIMIAALSPADINFEETLSTLRYADRAKQIKTSASVNEDPTEKLIRELQEENEKLKKMIESGKYEPIMGDDDDDDDDGQQSQGEKEQEYLSMLEKNRLEMEQMKKTFEERLQEAGETGGTDFNARSEKMKTTPHFYNLNPDPQLTGHIIFFLEGEEMTLGTDKESATISIRGPSIQPSHAFIRQAEGVFSVEPAVSHAKILHNGKTVGSKTDLKHHDRMMFGTTQLFVFAHPGQIDPKITYPDITYEFAQEEIRKKSGLDMDDESDGLLQDDLLESLPKIETANSYSEELNKKVKFTLIITSPEARGEHKGRNEVMVKVTNLETKYEWVWTKEKMFNRFFKMQEMFEDFQDGEEWDKKPEEDPFLDDMDADCYIGSVKLWLQSLSYVIESKEQLKMIDIQGKECGFLNYEIVPCNAKGKEYTENDDIFVDNPDELLGKDMHFKLKIISARGLPNKYSDAFAKYEFLLGGKTCQTKRIANTNNPDWNFSQQHDIPNVSLEALDYLKDGAVMIQIWGKQKKQKPKKTVNTKTAMLKETLSRGQLHAQSNEKKMDPDKVKYMMQAAMFKRRTEQLELKLHAMKKMLEVAEQNQKKKISVVLIKQIYHAPSADAAEKCIALIPKEKDDDDDDEDKTEDTKTKTNDETVKTDVVAGTHLVKDKKGTGNNSKHGKNDSDSSGSSSSDVSSSDEEDPPEKKQRKMEKRKRKAERQERKKRERELKEQGKVKSKLEVPKSNKKSSSCVLL